MLVFRVGSMNDLLYDSSLVGDDDGLERYAAAVQELVLWLRDEGHVLSSMDQHVIESWYEAGYPLQTVLRSIREVGGRMKKRKNPPRGLPLKSMRRNVSKAGQRALDRAVGATDAGPPPPPPAVEVEADPITVLITELDVAREGRDGTPLQALESSLGELKSLRGAGLLGEELFTHLLAVGRRYYEALDAALADESRRAMSDAIVQDLGDASRAMDPDALDETVRELRRRWLRREDPVLDPERFWCFE
jgi:hypothetical protein